MFSTTYSIYYVFFVNKNVINDLDFIFLTCFIFFAYTFGMFCIVLLPLGCFSSLTLSCMTFFLSLILINVFTLFYNNLSSIFHFNYIFSVIKDFFYVSIPHNFPNFLHWVYFTSPLSFLCYLNWLQLVIIFIICYCLCFRANVMFVKVHITVLKW